MERMPITRRAKMMAPTVMATEGSQLWWVMYVGTGSMEVCACTVETWSKEREMNVKRVW